MNRLIAALTIVGGIILGSQIPGNDTAQPIAPLPHQENDDDAPIYGIPPNEQVPTDLFHAAHMTGEVWDWGVDDMNFPAAWAMGVNGTGQVGAVLDTGVMALHGDLKAKIAGTRDFTNSASGPDDRNGHGTWCFGSIFAAKNDWGTQGAAWGADGLSYKVLGDDGTGSVVGIANAIRAAVDWRGPKGERCSVISMSLGGAGQDKYIPPAIAYAKSKGVIVVAAAGNSGPGNNTVDYPGGYPDVVCVAAHDQKRATARFSSRGVAVIVSGPGVNCRSTWPGPQQGQFATISGTSMATPRVAGAALLWCQARGGAWDDTRGARFVADMRASCTDLPPQGRDAASGYGVIDMAKLIGPVVTPPVPPKPVPERIIFDSADFTPSGLEKMRRLKLNTLEFTTNP